MPTGTGMEIRPTKVGEVQAKRGKKIKRGLNNNQSGVGGENGGSVYLEKPFSCWERAGGNEI